MGKMIAPVSVSMYGPISIYCLGSTNVGRVAFFKILSLKRTLVKPRIAAKENTVLSICRFHKLAVWVFAVSLNFLCSMLFIIQLDSANLGLTSEAQSSENWLAA